MHHSAILIIVLNYLIFAKFSVKMHFMLHFFPFHYSYFLFCPGGAELFFFVVQKETSRDSFAHDFSLTVRTQASYGSLSYVGLWFSIMLKICFFKT